MVLLLVRLLDDLRELDTDEPLLVRTRTEADLASLFAFVEAKREEWDEYRMQVTGWETARYLEAF